LVQKEKLILILALGRYFQELKVQASKSKICENYNHENDYNY
jgi:hypothetical protein